MGCIFLLLGLALPRIFMVLIWLFSPWFQNAYQTSLWPFMGFLFMPYTTLAYMLAMLQNNHSLSGIWLVIFIIAVLSDLGQGGHASHRTRCVYYHS